MIRLDLAYLAFFTPRSGSYLLCDRLQASGAGWPGEWFGPAETGDLEADGAAVRHLLSLSASDVARDGILGAKVTRFHFERFSDRLGSTVGLSDLDLVDWLSALAIDVRFVWVRRRDSARQAVSYWRALSTKQWSLVDPELRTAVDTSQFDPHELQRLENRIAEDEDWIEGYLARRRLDHTVVWYEDLAAAPDTIGRRVVEALGLKPPVSSLPATRFSRQADASSEMLVERYRSWRSAAAG